MSNVRRSQMQLPSSSALVPNEEFDRSIWELWQEQLPQANQVGMTVFGDLLLESSEGILLLRLSWFDFVEVGTVIEEAYWDLAKPPHKRPHWIYPELTAALPTRPRGLIYHFVQPLGMGGAASSRNVKLVPILDVHRGMKKLWEQVA